MFERFTDHARHAVVVAQLDARRRHHGTVRTEHLLMGVCAVREGPAVALLAASGVTPADIDADVSALPSPGALDAEALATLGIDLDQVRRQAEEAFGPGALDRRATARGWFRRRRRCEQGYTPFEPAAKKALELSLREALSFEHRYIGTEHILLGLLRTEEGAAHRVLAARGVTLAAVRAAVADRGRGSATG